MGNHPFTTKPPIQTTNEGMPEMEVAGNSESACQEQRLWSLLHNGYPPAAAVRAQVSSEVFWSWDRFGGGSSGVVLFGVGRFFGFG